MLIEQLPGIKVAKRKIVWLLPNGEYNLHDTQDYTKELIKELEK
jgi:hypothetical protein